jgi:hypothetical protein
VRASSQPPTLGQSRGNTAVRITLSSAIQLLARWRLTVDNSPQMAVPDHQASSRARSAREFIADLGPPIALAAALLPFAGVVVRWIAFSFGQTVRYPLDLALEAPTGELIAIGLQSLLPGLLALPAIAVYGYFAPMWHHTEKSRQLTKQFEALSPKITALQKKADALEASPGPEILKEVQEDAAALKSEVDGLNVEKERLDKQRPKDPPDPPRLVKGALKPFDRILSALYRHQRLVALIGVIYWAALLLFTPWPSSITNFGTLLLVLVLPQVARRTGRVTLSQAWPVVLIALTLAAVASGLNGDFIGNEAGDYHFAANVQLADGRYTRLGEANNRMILMACSQPGSIVTSVADSQIIAVGVEPWRIKPPIFPWPTLFGALTGHGPALGFYNPC